MKLIKRIISVGVAAALTVPLIPCAASAAEEQSTKSISNDYIEFSVNEDTGFFSIATLEGHPQKKADNNMDLLYDGSSVETSFTTVRIDGDDYIFGQDYGLFDITSSRAESTVDAVNNTITTVWNIKDITITQIAELSRTENTLHTGNVFLKYVVENTSNKTHNIGIRVMLDNSLGEIDAPVTLVQKEVAPISKETEFISNGRDPGANIRYIDSYEQPTKEAYITLSDKEAVATPDKIVVGHWYNIASTKWDYTPDKDFSFDTGFNSYGTADTATALYWEETEYEPGYKSGASVTYGVGEFTEGYRSSIFNISMELDGELEYEDGKYKNDIVEATINIYNNVDGSVDLNNAKLELTADDGITFLSGSDSNLVETETFSSELGFIGAGDVVTTKVKLRVAVQPELRALEVMATVTGNTSDDTVSVSKYIIAPGSSTSKVDFAITSIYADKYHITGQRVMTVKGTFPKELLDDKTKWKTALVNTEYPDIRYEIDQDDVTVSSDTEMMLINNYDMVEGIYKLEVAFFEDYKEIIGDMYISDQTVQIVNDPSYICPDFGIVGVLRYGSGMNSKYGLKAFNTEEELNQYKAVMAQDGVADIPLVLRGTFAPSRDPETDVIVGYTATSSFTVNNVLFGEARSTISHLGGNIVDGNINSNGVELYGVDSASSKNCELFSCDWKIRLDNTVEYTLAAQNIKIEAAGINGYTLSVVGGFLNLKYGVFGKSADYGDILNFGGKYTLAGYKNSDPGESAGKTSAGGSSGGSDSANKVEQPEWAKLSGSALYASAEITNCYVNKEGFVGIDSAFEIGISKASLRTGVRTPVFMLHLEVDTINDKYLGTIRLPIGKYTANMTLGFANVYMPAFDAYPLMINDLAFSLIAPPTNPIPLFDPYIDLTQLGFGLYNLVDIGDMVNAQSFEEAVQTVNSSLIEIQAQLGIMFVRVMNMVGAANLGINHWTLSLTGTLPIVPGISSAISGTARVTYPYTDPNKGEVPANVKLNVTVSNNLLNIFVTRGAMNIGFKPGESFDNFSIELYGGLFIPQQFPLIGGMELLGATGCLDLEGISGTVDAFGIELGLRMAWDDGNIIWIYSDDADVSDKLTMSNMVYVPVELTSDDTVQLFSDEGGTFISGKVNTSSEYRTLVVVGYSGAQPDISELNMTIDGTEYELTPATKENSYKDGNCYVMPDTGSGGRILIGVREQSAGEHEVKLSASTSGVRLNSMDVRGFVNSAKVQSVTENPDGTVTITADKSLKDSTIELYYTNSNDFYDNIITEKGEDEDGNTIVNVYKMVDGEKVEFDEKLREDLEEYRVYSEVVTEDTNTVTITPAPGADVKSGDYYVMAKVTSPYSRITRVYTDDKKSYVNEYEPVGVAGAQLIDAGNSIARLEVTDAENADYDSYLVSLYNETDGVYTAEEEACNAGAAYEFECEPGKTYHAEVTTVKISDDGETFYTSVEPYKTNSVTVHEPQKVGVSITLDTPTTVGNYVRTDSNETVTADYINGTTATFTAKTDEPVTGCFVYDGIEMNMITEAAQEFTYTGEFDDGMHTMSFKAVNSNGDATISDSVSFAVNSSAPSVMLENSFVKAENGRITIKGKAINTEKLRFMDKEIIPESDGSFEITEAVQLESAAKECTLTAVGYSGTETNVRVFALDPDFKTVDDLEILVNGEPAESVTLQPGETAEVTVRGYADGTARELLSDTVSLSVVQGNSSATIDSEGTLKAQASGTAYVKASYDLGSMIKGENTESYKLEDMLEVSIMKKADDVVPSLPDGSKVTRGTKLTLSADGDIYYTTDGSEPTRDSQLYTEPISITKDMTIKAFCCKDGYIDGDVSEFSYTVKTSGGGSSGGSSGGGGVQTTPAPEQSASSVITAEGAGETVDYGYMAELKTEDTSGKIYYTTDGSTPNKNSAEYTGPIRITEDTEIKAVVWHEGDEYSDVYTFSYTLNPYMIKLREGVTKTDLLDGYPDGTFLPDNSITRAETAALLRRASEMYGYTVRDGIFSDIDMWAKDYINELAAAEIVNGYDDGTFRPDNQVTRAEFVAMLMRIVGETGGASDFEDVRGHWAESYIDKAAEYGYIDGYPDGSFKPDGYITRAEATVILTKVFGLSTDGTVSRFSDVAPEHWAFGYIAD